MLIVAVIKLNGENLYKTCLSITIRCFYKRVWFGKHACPAAYNMKLIRTSCFASCQMAFRETQCLEAMLGFCLQVFLKPYLKLFSGGLLCNLYWLFPNEQILILFRLSQLAENATHSPVDEYTFLVWAHKKQ